MFFYLVGLQVPGGSFSLESSVRGSHDRSLGRDSNVKGRETTARVTDHEILSTSTIFRRPG